MNHAEKRMAGKYVEAFSWHKSIREFLEEIVTETPVLNVCSGPKDDFGDFRMDRFVKPIPPSTTGDWTALPFASDSFGAVFADPPWNLSQMKSCAEFCIEALRVAPVAYLMSPWLWVSRNAVRSKVWELYS